MTARRALTADQVSQNDHVMRNSVAQLSQGLKNGLMVTLDSQKRSFKGGKLRARIVQDGSRAPGTLATIPQLDGEYSDDDKTGIKDDEDEDAINSDLDDSGDEAANNDEEDEDIDSMLCTYDKVQRVKNKWKCTLKDGVLHANGKE